MADAFDVTLNFIVNNAEAKAALDDMIKQLNQLNQGGGTPGGVGTSIPIAQSVQQQIKPVLDSFQALQDAGGKFVDNTRKKIQDLGGDFGRLADVTQTTFQKLQSVGGFNGSINSTQIYQNMDEVNKRINEVTGSTENLGKATNETGKIASETYPNAAAEIEQLSNDWKNAQVPVEKLTKSFSDQQRQAFALQWEFRRLQYAGRALTEVATTFFVPATAFEAGIMALATNYVKHAEEATNTTKQWTSAENELKTAQANIGQAAASILLPTYKLLADLSLQASQFIAENPTILMNAIDIAGVIVAVSGLALLIAKGIRVYADINYTTATFQYMNASKTNLSAAGTMLAASENNLRAAGIEVAGTGSGLGTSAAIGAGGTSLAALGGAMAIPIGVGLILSQVVSLLSSLGQGGITATMNRNAPPGMKWIPSTNGRGPGSYVPDTGGGGGSNILNAPVGSVADLQTYYNEHAALVKDYDNQLTKLGDDYSKQILGIFTKLNTETIPNIENDPKWQKQINSVNDKFNKQLADITDKAGSYMTQWFQEVADFNQQQMDEEAQYYTDRLRAARDYGISAERAEEDHQREMEKLRRDHEDKVYDLVGERDALGLVLEKKRYDRERQDKEDAYNLDRSRALQDYQIKMSDMEQDFRNKQNLEIRDFNEKMARQAAEHQKQIKALEDDRQAQIDQIEQNKRDEIAAAQQAAAQDAVNAKKDFDTNLEAIVNAYKVAEAQKKQQLIDALYTLDPVYYAWLQNLTTSAQIATATVASFTAQLKAIVGGETTTQPSMNLRDSGGYMGQGSYTNASGYNEYVLNPRTTRWAEQMVGGKLTQGSMMQLISHGGQSFSFNTGINSQDRAWVRNVVQEAFDQSVREAFA